MLKAHSVAQIRAAEEALAVHAGWDGLMQTAARGLADALDAMAPGDLVLMLIGPGNNGGDALFAATHLLDRGVRVDLCLLDAEKVHAAGLEAAVAAGATVVDEPTGQRTCIDAVFGIGARPGLSGRAAQWAEWIERTAPFTVAVDVPSGVDVDGGTCPGQAVRADATVTFGTFKPALLLSPAADFAGADVTCVDIGLDPHLGPAVVEAIEPGDRHLLLDALGPTDGHKYTRGVVGIAAGSEEYAGAAHLCVAGAQAGPAGMVRFAGTPSLSARVVDRAPEVVASAGRVQAWVVGPGGGDDVGDAGCDSALRDEVPVVLDASALAHLPDRLSPSVLLTPHAGELARMLGVDRSEVEADPLGHARAASRRWDATVLLKGQRTVVVAPDGRVRVNLSGTPWLGTAGAGDVLAGLAGSLLAAGLDALDAGSLAAFLHGAAAVAANPGGPVTASAVAAALPRTLAAFLAGSLTHVRAGGLGVSGPQAEAVIDLDAYRHNVAGSGRVCPELCADGGRQGQWLRPRRTADRAGGPRGRCRLGGRRHGRRGSRAAPRRRHRTTAVLAGRARRGRRRCGRRRHRDDGVVGRSAGSDRRQRAATPRASSRSTRAWRATAPSGRTGPGWSRQRQRTTQRAGSRSRACGPTSPARTSRPTPPTTISSGCSRRPSPRWRPPVSLRGFGTSPTRPPR